MVKRLVRDGEPVALAQIAVKIDVAGEDVGDLHRRSASGIPTSSVAANSDERISPDLSTTWRRELRAASSITRNPSPSRAKPSTVSRPEMKRRVSSAPSSVVSACTVIPGRSARNGLRLPVLLDELHRVGAVHAEPREERGERVAALEAFLVSVGLSFRRHHVGNRKGERFDHRRARERRLGRLADGAERRDPGEQPDGSPRRSPRAA